MGTQANLIAWSLGMSCHPMPHLPIARTTGLYPDKIHNFRGFLLLACQDFFTHFDPSHLVGNNRIFEKSNLCTCKQNLACLTGDLGLSHR